jgi:hypothetical protein
MKKRNQKKQKRKQTLHSKKIYLQQIKNLLKFCSSESNENNGEKKRKMSKKGSVFYEIYH